MTEKKHKNSLSLVHSIKEELKKDKLAMISTIFLVAVFLIVYIYSMFLKQSNYVDVNIMDQYLAPLTNGHLLGTDNGGRDIIMMLMISARNSFNIAFAVTLITLVVGNILGVITGYFGGRFDLIFMRFTDFVMILPSMMIIIVFVTIIPRFNSWSLIGIISIFSWIGTTRLIRARTMTEVNRDYVRASKTSGTSDFKLCFGKYGPTCPP
ncbi:Oligopeptide transport system permease protein OppC [Lactococcus lactis]|nr:peptide ABC transporter permease [Lactococcus lactis subsp. lactis]MDU0407071.1 Oligopeptide transport system permease protein OppC [Lactococcus lactis]